MIIVLQPNSTQQQIDHILERIQELGFTPHLSRGALRTIIGVIGDENKLQASRWRRFRAWSRCCRS